MDVWVVKYASRRSRIGDFSGDSSVRGAMFLGVLASWASESKGEGRLRGGAAHPGMEAKALLVGTEPRGRRRCRNGLQAQYFLARPRPERDAVGAGRRPQGPECEMSAR